MLYVLNGTICVLLNDRTVEARKGALVYILSGTGYSFTVQSEEAHCLNLPTRAGFEDLVQLVGIEGRGMKKAPPGSFQEKTVDGGARSRLMAKIGLQELALTPILT